MPYCPECRYEYQAEIQVCPDCGATLVAELPEETVPEIQWVPLHPLPGSIYAEMVKEVLDKEHIPNILIRDFFASAAGVAGVGLPGMVGLLLVPKEQAQKAERILHDMLDHI